jgi:tetratricopeptide (TPR) repeat protein
MRREIPCALLTFVLTATLAWADPPQVDSRVPLNNTLLIQTAMARANEMLRERNPRGAVEVLEEQLPRLNGNLAYLQLLRRAYRETIVELHASQLPNQANIILERLAILDPAALNDPTLRPIARPVAAAPQPEPPPAAPKSILPDFLKNMPFAKKDEPKPAPTSLPQPEKEPVFRGVMNDDPFDASQRRAAPAGDNQKASQYVALGNEEFDRKRYAQARFYYEQACQADQASLTLCKDRLAYCVLNNVVEQVNQPNLGGKSAIELKDQVQQAVKLAPTLDDTGRWLLSEIEKRSRIAASPNPPPNVQTTAARVKHLGRNKEGWQVAESVNFRIFHLQNSEFAEQVAQVAERARLEQQRKWFGGDGVAWTPKCELILHPTGVSYTEMTKIPASSPGHSRIESDTTGKQIIGRRMDLRLDNANVIDAVLPHETTHVVLAGQFGHLEVPRWADEGIAVLAEPRDQIELHRRNLLKAREEGTLFPLRDLMQLKNYPAPRLISVFYAQSVSLVDFLARQKGPAAFTAFLRDGMAQDYDSALQRHFGMTFPQLEQAWQQSLGNERVVSR